MPRVLFIDVAPFAGGAQASFRTLIECAENCDQALATGDGLWEWARQKNLPVLRLTTTHWRANLRGWLQYRRECRENRALLQDFIRKFKPDLIHCNTVRSALLLCALPRLKAKVIIHDRDLRMPRLARWYAAKRLSPFIVAVSLMVCEKWREIVPDSHRIILPNGFDLEAIAQTAPAVPDALQRHCGVDEFNDGKNTVATPYIIVAADFEPWKNHRLFLKAFQLAQAKCPQLCAILKGRLRPSGAEYLEELRNFVKDHQLPNVHFIADDSPAISWIASAQLLVTCSSNEPFGRTAIEALALGKHVVATKNALAPELFQLDGVTQCPTTPIDLAQAILKAIELPPPHPELTSFSKKTLAEELSKLYGLLL